MTQKGQTRDPNELRARYLDSRNRLEIETPFQSTTNRKWPMGIEWSRDRRHHMTPKGQTRDPNTLRAQYVVNSWKCYLASC